ncbi:MAG TPA: hypothetical protein VF194_04245 [Ferrovibrio sp.]|jgi:hypothetical protein|uniref:hypothetical protein n=1 Tax=Ferrovibrio sp. TaxID=1917215 RepID=UPI002ED36912
MAPPPPHPTVRFRLGVAVWTMQGPPHHGVGEVDFYATPKNKEQAALSAFQRQFRPAAGGCDGESHSVQDGRCRMRDSA